MCATTSASVAGGMLLRYSSTSAGLFSARAAAILAVTSLSASAVFCERKSQLKLTCTTPPFFASATIISSVMLRGTLDSARQEECEANGGALLTSNASQKVLSATWEISTIIPSRFISRTTCLPKSVNPLWCSTPALSMSPDESDQLLVLEWV